MAIEQTLQNAQAAQLRHVKSYARPKWSEALPAPVLQFIERWIGLSDTNNMVLLAGTEMIESQTGVTMEDNPAIASHAISMKNLNDFQKLNLFLRTANESIETGGYFIGQLETSYLRKERIISRYPKLLGTFIYVIDYLIFRVWAKLPYLRNLYFLLLGKQPRAISEMEALGRLYFSGFTFMDSITVDGTYYFAVKKTKPPEYNRKPGVGPLITLRRNGKDGKIIHVYKLRTMFPYAEFLQQHVYEQQGLAEGGKIEKDPRVNMAGFILRKYFLDEIPMIFNLLNGDLKIVGVRPISKQYLSLYPKEAQEFRRKFKPGLIPPFYADLPKTLDEIVASEMRYLKAYEKQPLLTDIRVISKAFYNIVFKMARSL